MSLSKSFKAHKIIPFKMEVIFFNKSSLVIKVGK